MLDAHCHYFPKPGAHNVFYNSVTSSDWSRIPKQSDIIPFYGIHPWYAKTCSKNELTLLDELVARKMEVGERFGLGETGLDKTNRNLDEEAREALKALGGIKKVAIVEYEDSIEAVRSRFTNKLNNTIFHVNYLAIF